MIFVNTNVSFFFYKDYMIRNKAKSDTDRRIYYKIVPHCI